jgi:ribosomal protein L22
MKYAICTKEKARALGTFPISTQKAAIVCKMINRKKFAEAKKTLEKMVDKEQSLKGKYYTKTSEEILGLLKQLESNAKALNIDPDVLNLFVSSHRGSTMYRSKRDRRHGVRMKMTHVQAVLSDKNGFGKEVR